jgi:hypothetical protein
MKFEESRDWRMSDCQTAANLMVARYLATQSKVGRLQLDIRRDLNERIYSFHVPQDHHTRP